MSNKTLIRRPTFDPPAQIRFAIVLNLMAMALSACGGATLPRVEGAQNVTGADEPMLMDEIRIVASREEGELLFESYDAGQLFERGTVLLNAGRCREAVEGPYARLIREFPETSHTSAALYNSGLCLHEGGELEEAAPYYRRIVEEHSRSRDARHAILQLAQVLIGLERWEPALARADEALLRDDISSAERLEALTRRGQALLGSRRLDDAERQARDALSYYRTRRGDQEIREPYFAAASNYVLAETIRHRAAEIAIPDADVAVQHTVLERRAQFILQAQREYFNTIGFTNAEWAAAAGYRIGTMYDALWSALMEAPVPPPSRELAESALPIYRREFRMELAQHIRPLLRHAIRYWELTLTMVERTGVQTEWATRTEGELARMRQLLLGLNAPEEEEDASPEQPLQTPTPSPDPSGPII